MHKLDKKTFILPIMILFLFGLAYIVYKNHSKTEYTISYKSFMNMVSKGKINEITLSDSDTIRFTEKTGTKGITQNPRTASFKESMLLKGISVTEDSGSGAETTALTAFIITASIIGVYFYTKKSGTGSGSLKLSSIDAAIKDSPDITFDDIAGNNEAKESIKDLVDFIKNPDKYQKYNARIPRGVILYGPPGTGKTLLAKALSKEADAAFFAVNGSDFVQIYVGVGAGRIRDLFKKAREKEKAVIFIDEIDAIGRRRKDAGDGGSEERDQTLNALLSEMSGFRKNEGIIVVAATNRLDILDEALIRPGRFDRHVEVALPDVNARFEILKLYSNDKPLSSDIDLKQLASLTVYFSGAKLESMMNEAAIYAAKEDAELIMQKHIDRAYTAVLAGEEKKDRSYITAADRKLTAYHEAGHALASKLFCPETSVARVSIIPSTKGAGGYTLNIPPDNIYATKSQLKNRIKVGLGGRAAEDIIYGSENITTGASGDIKTVTQIALSMIKEYGMSLDAGLVNFFDMEAYGDTVSGVSDIVKKLISELYSETKAALKENVHLLNAITDLLIEKEVIYEKDLDQIMSITN